MKTNILKIAVILLVLAGGIGSCGEREEDNFPEPIEIPFTEYSIVGTSGQWKNLALGKVIVINSHEELKKHFDCTNLDCPEIDFSKHTLLLASGGATNGVYGIDATFFQNSKNRYTLKTMIHLGITAVAMPWYMEILVPKISKKSTVTLEVQTTYN